MPSGWAGWPSWCGRCPIAELEIQGHYVEAEHDLFFEAFDAHMLSADDLARFPDYLVCMPPRAQRRARERPSDGNAQCRAALKVLVQTHELQDDAAIGTGHYAFGVRSARLGTTAMGLGGLFVLQTPSSNLVALTKQLARGMACPRAGAVQRVCAAGHGQRRVAALPGGCGGAAIARLRRLLL